MERGRNAVQRHAIYFALHWRPQERGIYLQVKGNRNFLFLHELTNLAQDLPLYTTSPQAFVDCAGLHNTLYEPNSDA